MNKKTKIILAVVFAVLFIIGLSLGLYFGLKDKPSETVFSDTGTVEVVDADTIEFSYICPYMSKNTTFKITDNNGFYVSFSENEEEIKIKGEIISSEYTANESDMINNGLLSLTIDLDEELKAGTTYHAVLEENSVELKKMDYVNGDITADFTVSTDSDGNLDAEEERYVNAKLAVPSNVSASISKENGKHYFCFTANIDGITQYDEARLKNYQVYAGYSCKTENGRIIRYVNENDDTQYTVDAGKVTIKCEVDSDDLYPGTDYKYAVSKGFFTNADKSVVSDLCEGTFTYVEQ